ncbi:MAG: flagellar hook-associated protein FlgL [Nitrospirae bacterium]|nr:flagellar hook-associated protein FlgL [Nitrospirota bacterium]
MRVSNKEMFNTVMGNLHRNMEKLLEYQNSASSGRRIIKPSDDPAGATKILDYNTAISRTEQYQRNINNATAFLNATETAVSATQDNFIRVKELAIFALNGSNNAADRRSMAKEVQQLYEQVRQIANTKYDDRYIFSGLRTDAAPYDFTDSYNGTASPGGKMDIEIDTGSTISINVPGYDVFGSATDGTDILATLNNLKTAMENNDVNGIEGAMTDLEAGMDQVNNARAGIGARLNRLETAKNHFDKLQFDLAKYKSDTEDADITKIISDMTLQQSMLEASRATAARVLQLSILDFLR